MLEEYFLSSVLQYAKKEEEINMLTPYISENDTALIYGQSGSGKTQFIVNHLNENNIVPILIDFDNNQTSHFKAVNQKSEVLIVEGVDFLSAILKKSNSQLRQDLKGKVLILDTWVLINVWFNERGTPLTEQQVYKKLKTLKDNIEDCTIIIIAHADCFGSKEDKPEMDSAVYNHIDTRLNIKVHTTTTKRTYTLFVEKVRGYTGEKIRLLRVEELKKPK